MGEKSEGADKIMGNGLQRHVEQAYLRAVVVAEKLSDIWQLIA